MLQKKNVSLKEFNTFGLEAKASWWIDIQSTDQLKELIQDEKLIEPRMILGGGSNILLTKDFEGLILKNEIKGIEIIREDEEYAWIKAGGGEIWHELVLWSIGHDLGGLENMSLIPGSVGAAPIQNIGAYGRELKHSFDSLEAVHMEGGEIETFDYNSCQFGYRDSFFKRAGKGKYMITHVILKLQKNPQLNTSYGAIQSELETMGIAEPQIRDVSNAVIRIRQSKLPDPKEIGNSGSFFKNPVVSESDFNRLKTAYPNIPNYPAPNGVKLAAGWLIEQCGWKGYREGDFGVHSKQALVLVNYGNANGSDIYHLSSQILNSVKEKFGVELEREVQII